MSGTKSFFLLVTIEGRPPTWLCLRAGNVGGGGNHAGCGWQVTGRRQRVLVQRPQFLRQKEIHTQTSESHRTCWPCSSAQCKSANYQQNTWYVSVKNSSYLLHHKFETRGNKLTKELWQNLVVGKFPSHKVRTERESFSRMKREREDSHQGTQRGN